MEDNKYVEDYPKFTASMSKTHTILIPSMLEIHFALFENALKSTGYKVEILQNQGPNVITEGLKYAHNDMCYPALLVIGQFIDALQQRDDLDKVVLLITQTGGGCRASNYLHLLRKALRNAGYGFIPVVSLNASNLEKDSGLRLTYSLIMKIAAAMTYGDQIMYLYNKTRSYEKHKGEAKSLVDRWVKKLRALFDINKGTSYRALKKNMKLIAQDFDALELNEVCKPKVGIVGEIYIKYAALGNNNLEELLISSGAEIMVPGLYSFIFYCVYDSVFDQEFYGNNKFSKLISKVLIWYLGRREKLMIKSIKPTKFTPMHRFSNTLNASEGILSHGVKMGEGWLLTAEMVELTHSGYKNIVCAQPFGCLPNHICGKGVMKKIKQLYPEANIVSIDYDPSATKVNQENRIKLMLAIANETLTDKFSL